MLNITQTIYTGWNSNTKNELSEAEIIPLGTTANEKKKLDKITKRYNTIRKHDNIPLPGFTLYKTGRRSWGSLDQTWLVIDPRGFLVRITSGNLDKIMHVTGITEGLIQQKCIWARNNTETRMELVPVSADLYTEAMGNTKMLEEKVSIKDVQIGDKVLLQNKMTGTYCGTVSLYGNLIKTNIEKLLPRQFPKRQVLEVSPGKYYYQTDLKILKVLEKTETPITREESVAKLSETIPDVNTFFTSSTYMKGRYYSSDRVKFISAVASSKVEMSFVEIDLEEAKELFNKAVAEIDMGILLLEDNAGKFSVLDCQWSYSNTTISHNAFRTAAVINIDDVTQRFTEIIREKEPYSYAYSRKKETSLDSYNKYYKIVKHIKNETYI